MVIPIMGRKLELNKNKKKQIRASKWNCLGNLKLSRQIAGYHQVIGEYLEDVESKNREKPEILNTTKDQFAEQQKMLQR